MKKTIFAMASLVLLATACSKEASVNTKDITFTATINQIQDTKVQLEEGTTAGKVTTYPVKFIAGDVISVLKSGSQATTAFSSVQTGKSVQFSLTDPEAMDTDFYTSATGYDFYYPYNEDLIPAVAPKQTMVKGNASIGGITLFAHTDDTALDDAKVEFDIMSTLLRIKPTSPKNVAAIYFVNGNDVVALACDSSNAYEEYVLGVNPGSLDFDAVVWLQDREGNTIGNPKYLNQANGQSLNRSLVAGRLVNVTVNVD